MRWRDNAFRIYWWLEKRIAPEICSAHYHYEARLLELVPVGAVWLDAGCGHRLLHEQRLHQEKELVARARLLIGLDYDRLSLAKHRTLGARVRGDVSRLPFREASFDVVSANMVLEHLRDPHLSLAEIKRVLKPGGILVLHTPNRNSPLIVIASCVPDALKRRIVTMVEGRSEKDIFPTYYRANTEKQLLRISRELGFEVERLDLVPSSGHPILGFCPPVAAAELLYLKAIRRYRVLRQFRTNIVAVLRKPNIPQGAPS